jgi:ankyrin repeat protein
MPTEVKFLPDISAAIRSHDLLAVKKLFVDHPDHIDAYTPFAGGTWLHFAAGHDSVEIVAHLIDLGMNVNEGDMREGRTPLVDACAAGNFDIAKYLLDHGAQLDVSASVRNPLFAAIAEGSIAIVKLLLNHGIDASVRYDSDTMKNMDAVAFAMMWGQRDIAHVIALGNAGGDEAAAQAAMAEGLRIAQENTKPRPPSEEYAQT